MPVNDKGCTTRLGITYRRGVAYIADTKEPPMADQPTTHSLIDSASAAGLTPADLFQPPAGLAAIDECMATGVMKFTGKDGTIGTWYAGPDDFRGIPHRHWHPSASTPGSLEQAMGCLEGRKWVGGHHEAGKHWLRIWDDYTGWSDAFYAPTLQLAICLALMKMKESESDD